jgi:hypothetical protein
VMPVPPPPPPAPPKPPEKAAAPPPPRPAPPPVPPKPVASSGPPPIPKPSAPPPPPSRGPAPPRSAPPPPPTGAKKRGPAFWGITGCCGCLTILVILGGVGALLLPQAGEKLRFWVKGPQDVVRGELAEIHDGKVDQAYDRLADTYKSRFSRGQFESFLTAHAGLRTNKSTVFNETQIFNDTAQLSGVVTSESGGKEEIRVELRREGTIWKITLFEVWERASSLGGRSLTPQA